MEAVNFFMIIFNLEKDWKHSYTNGIEINDKSVTLCCLV
jgi:hypothetical protein